MVGDCVDMVYISLACENDAGGRKSIFSINIYIGLIFVLFFVVIIELFSNSIFQLYCPKDYYMQKQWNTLPVTVIPEIMNFNRLLWWLPWHRQLVLVFGNLD